MKHAVTLPMSSSTKEDNMKTLVTSLILIASTLLWSCKDDLLGLDRGKNDDFHTRIAAEVPKPDGTGKNTVRDEENSLTVAAQQPITLIVDNSFETITHVEWTVNGEKIGEGNHLQTTIDGAGIHQLSVNYRIGKQRYSKQLDVYAYVTKRLSFKIIPDRDVCGKVAIGITQHLGNGGKIGPGYSKATVQDICTTDGRKTATAANIEVN